MSFTCFVNGVMAIASDRLTACTVARIQEHPVMCSLVPLFFFSRSPTKAALLSLPFLLGTHPGLPLPAISFCYSTASRLPSPVHWPGVTKCTIKVGACRSLLHHLWWAPLWWWLPCPTSTPHLFLLTSAIFLFSLSVPIGFLFFFFLSMLVCTLFLFPSFIYASHCCSCQ